MLEVYGDFWTYGPVDARCVTTNQHVTARGLAVMGRGIALQAKQKYPGVDLTLGMMLRSGDLGQHVQILHEGGWAGSPRGEPTLLSYPVKTHDPVQCQPAKPCWREKASLDLIIRSAYELVELAHRMGWNRVLLPRPGCGNGGLDWEVVQWPLSVILNDRFHVIERPDRA